MKLNKILPIKVYRAYSGGSNYIIVDEVFIFSDSNGMNIVLQKNEFRKTLYSDSEVEEALNEEGFLYFENESALKIFCCWYRLRLNYILFNAADSFEGQILTKTEILGEDINSELYKCAPRVLYLIPKDRKIKEFNGTSLGILNETSIGF